MTLATLSLQTQGMTCDDCAPMVERALAGMPGLVEVRVSWPSSIADRKSVV